MSARTYPLYLANEPQTPNESLEVQDKFSQTPYVKVPLADSALMDRAIHASAQGAKLMRRLPGYAKRDILLQCVGTLEQRRADFVDVLCAEVGKPVRDARMEVDRLIETFSLAAIEATRLGGEVLPVDFSERNENVHVQWRRFPMGACAFITPFNFPLNLVAHKVAPAIAAGCSFVLKPASRTPLSALLLGEVLASTDLPKGAFSILPCSREVGNALVTDDRLQLVSFTGSPSVGWELKRQAGRKKVVLELGGNAACVVCADWEVNDAVDRVVAGAFGNSGQSCISVQRVLVERCVYEEFRATLCERVQKLKSGDPRHEDTVVGPLISEKEAIRLQDWTQSAVAQGAQVCVGGGRVGALLEPTVLESVDPAHPLWAQEAFGPVVALEPFDEFSEALATVNKSDFGLQAGVLTRDLYRAWQAWETLEVGGVIVGSVPSWRSDAMPYGGLKQSGIGREGVRFAVEEMTEIRVLALHGVVGLK